MPCPQLLPPPPAYLPWLPSTHPPALVPAQVQLTTLKLLTLDSNSLSGTLPSEFGKLWNLNVLWLHYNQMSGEVL